MNIRSELPVSKNGVQISTFSLWSNKNRGSDMQGCHLWGCTKSDTTEVTQQQQTRREMQESSSTLWLPVAAVRVQQLVITTSDHQACSHPGTALLTWADVDRWPRPMAISRESICAFSLREEQSPHSFTSSINI